MAIKIKELAFVCHCVTGIAWVPVTLEPQDFPPCRMFAINSPDGYAIMLHQRKA